MSKADNQMQRIVSYIITHGSEIETRNSKVKRTMNEFVQFTDTPLICSRKTAWKSALREMEWFLSGSNNIKDLHPSVHKWWQPWANEEGEVINNYGAQFNHFVGFHNTVNQIEYMINTLKQHPNSRRNVITTWNTADMIDPTTPITNCHGTIIQCFVEPDDKVWMTMYQRSCDMLLGVPHNWIQYWALLMWFAHRSNRKVGGFTWIGGDCHVYESHFSFAKKLERVDLTNLQSPQLIYNPTSIEFKASDFKLDSDYEPIFEESLPMVI